MSKEKPREATYLFRIAKGHGDRPATIKDGALSRLHVPGVSYLGLHPWLGYDVLDISIPRRTEMPTYVIGGPKCWKKKYRK